MTPTVVSIAATMRLKSALNEPVVSVVVCTRDRPHDLARCLPTILANHRPRFEIIVVDQSADEASARVVADLGDPRLSWRRLPGKGLSRARNEALADARGGIFAFTDDDCTVPPTWLGRGVAVLETEPEAGVVFGAVAAMPHDPARTYVPAFVPSAYRLLSSLDAPIPVLHRTGMGANIFARRTVFERAGRFDEALGRGARFRSAEDCDLAYRALRAGFLLVQDPENVVVHWGGRDLANGAAHRLAADDYFGIGASYARHVRRGDLVAGRLLLREGAELLKSVVANMLGRRAPTGARGLAYFLAGAAVALGSPAPVSPPLVRWRA